MPSVGPTLLSVEKRGDGDGDGVGVIDSCCYHRKCTEDAHEAIHGKEGE